MIKILFICHGNICRSPMAEFVLKDMVTKQGIADVHAGEPLEDHGQDVGAAGGALHIEQDGRAQGGEDDGKEQQDIAGKRRFSMFAVSFRLMTVNAGMGQNAIQHVEQQCSHGEACGHGHKVQPSPGCSRQFKSRAEQTPE